MIRLTLLWLDVGFLAVCAWRDRYRALYGLVLAMAVTEHPDIPKTLFRIHTLNSWNIFLVSVSLAWAAARKRENLARHWPPTINRLQFEWQSLIPA